MGVWMAAEYESESWKSQGGGCSGFYSNTVQLMVNTKRIVWVHRRDSGQLNFDKTNRFCYPITNSQKEKQLHQLKFALSARMPLFTSPPLPSYPNVARSTPTLAFSMSVAAGGAVSRRREETQNEQWMAGRSRTLTEYVIKTASKLFFLPRTFTAYYYISS